MPTDVEVLKFVDANLIEGAINDDRDYNHFHPSEWDRCHRKLAYLYYEAKGFIQVSQKALKISPRLQRCFGNGHYMHDRWGSYLAQTGRLYGRWVCQNFWAHDTPKIYGENNSLGVKKPEKCECGSSVFKYKEIGYYDPETMWGGHVDAIFDTKGDESPQSMIIVDFKSMNWRYFRDLVKPHDEHFTQIQIYMYLSGLPAGKFIYENKNDQNVKEFWVPRDNDFLAKKRLEALKLKKVVTYENKKGTHVLPDIPDNDGQWPTKNSRTKGHKECVECKFRANCWKLKT